MGKNALLEFEDFTCYVKMPPAYESLFSDVQMCDAKGRVLIVLPVYSESDSAIERHLRCLMAQTFRDFDILLVYGPADPFFRKFDGKLRVHHAHRRFDYGFAGAVYAGQKFAVKQGYGYVMWSDIDRLPIGDGYIRKMLDAAAEKKADVVLADYVVVSANGGQPLPERKPEPTVLYSLVSTSVFPKIGYTFLPIFMGADDAEYLARLLTFGGGAGIACVKSGLKNQATYRSVFYREAAIGEKKVFLARFLSDLWLATKLTGEARAGMKKHFIYPYMYVNLFASIFPDEGREIKHLAGRGKIGKVVLGNLIDKYFDRKTVKLTDEMEGKYWRIYACPWKKYGSARGASQLRQVKPGVLSWLAEMACLFSLGNGRLGVDIELSKTGSLFLGFPTFLLANKVDLIDYDDGCVYSLERKRKRNTACIFFGMLMAIAYDFVSVCLRKMMSIGTAGRYKELLGYGSA